MPAERSREQQKARLEALAQEVQQAEAFMASGQLTQALGLAQRLLGVSETHAKAVLLCCRICSLLGDTGQALVYAERVARKAPDLPQARTLLASCLHAAGDCNGCRTQCHLALEQEPDNAEALRLLLSAGLRLGLGACDAPHAAALASISDSLMDWGLCLRVLAGAGRPFGLVALQGDVVIGAALDPARPDAVLRVVCQSQSGASGVVMADQPHPALAVAQLPGGHGFSLTIPGHLAGDRLYFTLENGEALYGSPLVAPGLTSGPGRVEVRDGLVVLGMGQPHGKVVLRDRAGREREVQTDGAGGFSLTWKPGPADGGCASLQAFDAATGQELDGSPVEVFDPKASARALASFNGWLRLAGLSPDAPPPLPPACRGEFLRMARGILAERQAVLEGLAAQLEQNEEDDDVSRGS